MFLPILHGCCTIQLYKMVGGSKRWSHSKVWKVCGNTLVDECNFKALNQSRWTMTRNGKSYYVKRKERLPNGKFLNIYMAREILGLPPGAGHTGGIGDHENHDTLDNTLDNIRVANQSQSNANKIPICTSVRFKGVALNGPGFLARIKYKKRLICFPTMKREIKAGLLHFYAGTLLFKDFYCGSDFPQDELPSEEQQEELFQMVVKKLTRYGVSIDGTICRPRVPVH